MAQIPGMTMPRTGPPPFRAKPGGKMAPPRPGGMPPKPGGMPPKPGGKMMAGGGFGAPAPFGGGAAPPPAAPAPGGGGVDPDMDGDIDSPMIKPEAVNYHDEAQSCSLCQYMGDGGQCSVLKMQVSPDGGCSAFEGGAPADTDQDAGGGDMDLSDQAPGGQPPPAY